MTLSSEAKLSQAVTMNLPAMASQIEHWPIDRLIPYARQSANALGSASGANCGEAYGSSGSPIRSSLIARTALLPAMACCRPHTRLQLPESAGDRFSII